MLEQRSLAQTHLLIFWKLQTLSSKLVPFLQVIRLLLSLAGDSATLGRLRFHLQVHSLVPRWLKYLLSKLLDAPLQLLDLLLQISTRVVSSSYSPLLMRFVRSLHVQGVATEIVVSATTFSLSDARRSCRVFTFLSLPAITNHAML